MTLKLKEENLESGNKRVKSHLLCDGNEFVLSHLAGKKNCLDRLSTK